MGIVWKKPNDFCLIPGTGVIRYSFVGFEAGFNSKTTFYTVFKKFIGLTPTEYPEKNKPERERDFQE